MRALILAAGYAVRLYPLTKQYPKPLLEVGKRPIINYIVEKLESAGQIKEITVITNSKFASIFKKWASRINCSKPLDVVNDLTSTPFDKRGAIGDMDFAISKKNISEDLLVIGGDNLFDGNLEDFLDFAKKSGGRPVIGAYNIGNLREAAKYGVLKLDKNKKIVDFKEKPKKPKSTLVAMCLYYFPRRKLKLIKEYLKDKEHKSDAIGFYIDWLRKKVPVYGFVYEGLWYDIGDKKFYRRAEDKFKQGG